MQTLVRLGFRAPGLNSRAVKSHTLNLIYLTVMKINWRLEQLKIALDPQSKIEISHLKMLFLAESHKLKVCC